MNDNKRNIDEFFQQELGGATEMPPSSVWESLEQRLEQKPRSRKISWWFYLLIALLFVGGSIGAYFATQHNRPHTTIPAGVSETPVSDPDAGEAATGTGFTDVSTATHPEESIPNAGGVHNNNSTANNSKQLSPDRNNPTQSEEKQNRTIPSKKEKASETPADPGHTMQQNGNLLPRTPRAGDNDAAGKPYARTKSSSNTSAASATRQESSPNTAVSNTAGTAGRPDGSGNLAAVQSRNTKRNFGGSAVTAGVPANKLDKGGSRGALANNRSSSGALPSQSLSSNTNAKTSEGTSLPQAGNIGKAKPGLAGASTEGNRNNIGSREKMADTKTDKAVGKQMAGATREQSKTETKPEPVKPTQKVPVSKPANLSGVPSDFEYDADEGKKNEDDEADQETTTVSAARNDDQSRKKPASPQLDRIEKARAANPLAGAPIAQAEVEQTLNEMAGNATPAESAGGAGGGGGAKQEKAKVRKPLNMLIGVKGGYEKGFQQYTAGKFVASIFGEVNFTRKLSFVMQPGIKFANTNRDYSTVTGSYYRADSVVTTLYNRRVDTMGKPTGFNDYAFRQSYDSMVASIIARRKYIEIEIPFLFRYKVDEHLSVMAGMNFTFGKILGFENALKTISGLSLVDTLRNYFDTGKGGPPVPGTFAHTGSTPFSAYKATEQNTISPVRFGYTLGLTYTVRKRLMVDLTIQQNLSGLSNINNAEARKLFTQPYVRFSLGYILFGAKK